MSNHSDEYYYALKTNVSDSSLGECYLKIGNGLNNKTENVYPEVGSIIGGLSALFTGIAGLSLNLLFVYALLKNPLIRKDFLTPFFVSLSSTDILFSGLVLPIRAVLYFVRYLINRVIYFFS